MKKILFLDFDGVLNNVEWYGSAARKEQPALEWVDGKPRRNSARDFDPANLAALGALMRAVPDLLIVVSSTWRFGRTIEELRDLLHPEVPRGRVIGKTPRLASRLRYEEIRAWLAEYAPGALFVAFDDDTADMIQLDENFIHVPSSVGLTPEHVEKALAHFGASGTGS